MACLVIGNGESRKNISLKSRDYDLTIGCNAVLRDYPVDYLVCVDRRMVKEALEQKYKPVIYTRKDWLSGFSYPVVPVPELPYKGSNRPDDPFHWGSGPYAILIGALESNKVDLVGFDLYGIDNKLNNIYKNTHGYDDSHKNAVDPRYWIYQIGKIFECFPNTKFTIYNKKDWNLPDNWIFSNVSLDIVDNL